MLYLPTSEQPEISGIAMERQRIVDQGLTNEAAAVISRLIYGGDNPISDGWRFRDLSRDVETYINTGQVPALI